MLTFGTATAPFKTDMIPKHIYICWDGCCFSNQNKHEFESNLFCLIPRKTCCNLPVVRVVAIPKRKIRVLRVILQPRAEKVLKILYTLNFQLFLSILERKKSQKELVTSIFVPKRKTKYECKLTVAIR